MQLVAYVAQDVYFTFFIWHFHELIDLQIPLQIDELIEPPRENDTGATRTRPHERMRQGPRKSDNLCPVPQASSFIISAV